MKGCGDDHHGIVVLLFSRGCRYNDAKQVQHLYHIVCRDVTLMQVGREERRQEGGREGECRRGEGGEQET